MIRVCNQKRKASFTTKDTKSTKFMAKISEPFVAFVRFVVRKYCLVSKWFINGSTLYERRVC
jgi:hypothetical protein